MIAAKRLDENPCRPKHFKPAPCAPLSLQGPNHELLDTSRSRLLVAGALFALVFAVVALRLVEIVAFRGATAESHVARFKPVKPSLMGRADIVDRNGNLLATTLDSPSLSANPKQILDPADTARKVAAVLPGLSEREAYAKLTSEKSFIWLKRHLTPRQQYDVNKLGIPGFQFDHEERRLYPLGELAAHVVGYSGIDNKGLAGVERGLDDMLKTRTEPLQLSIDSRIQHILHEELQRTITDFTALGGAGMIMDVRTGEIVGMVSLPDFDPNAPGKAVKDQIFNRNTLGAYEMGSTFKILNTAMALDSGIATMTKTYDATHGIKIGRFTIEDYHGKHRVLSVPEIFMYSSNIGSARMAVEAGAERQRSFLAKFGMLKMPTIETAEVGAPLFPAQWREINVMTIAYGHGISVTPLHVVSAVSAVVNGGILHQATLLKMPPGYQPPGERVISQKTSDEMRKLMRLVVEHGTGGMAEAPGYVVGGKTGTAEKVVGHTYALKKLLTSFIGAFPINDPKYVILVMVDEPNGNKASHGYATAGWTAAPAVSRIITRAAPLLGIAPVDTNAPEIRKALQIDSLVGKKIEAY